MQRPDFVYDHIAEPVTEELDLEGRLMDRVL